MNKRLILLGVAIFLALTLLIGVAWDWVSALAFAIGLSLFALIVLGRMALLKFYLKTYSLRTILYTNPFSAMLYSVVDPHRRNNSSDLDDLFPSQKRQEPEEPV